ncbi:PLDc N-terminal domain-containing protein [Arcanobacterium bovis]
MLAAIKQQNESLLSNANYSHVIVLALTILSVYITIYCWIQIWKDSNQPMSSKIVLAIIVAIPFVGPLVWLVTRSKK